MVKAILSLLILTPASLYGASFTLGATIAAGSLAGNELFVGATSGNSSAAASVSPYWVSGSNNNYDFSLAYNGGTNTLTLTALTGTSPSSASWFVTGGTANPGILNWTIAAGGVQAVAEDNDATNTQIRIRNLSLSGAGFATLSPATLVANQNGGGTVTASNNAPITFSTAAGSGSWVLSGEIRFTGLATSTPGGAAGSQLRAVFDVLAVQDVPEPAALLMGALGLAALGVLYHFRARRVARAAKANPTAGKQEKA